MRRHYTILIKICLIALSCNSNKKSDQTAIVKPVHIQAEPSVHETSSTTFLKKMADRLHKDYNSATGTEAKINVISKYDTEMNKQLQTNNQEMDSIPVKVEKIDSALTDFLYIRFSNPYADFVCSMQKERLAKNPDLKNLVQTLTPGSKRFINFKVLSLKVNEPTNILPPFEMEGNLLVMKAEKTTNPGSF